MRGEIMQVAHKKEELDEVLEREEQGRETVKAA